MEVTANYLSDTKFQVGTRGHTLICDQPTENGGLDEGMSPPEFLLASLATCAAYYAAQYLKARGLPAGNLTVRVTAEKAQHPTRLGSFAVDITAPGLEGRLEEGVLRAVKACLIHNTLQAGPHIDVSVNAAVPAHA